MKTNIIRGAALRTALSAGAALAILFCSSPSFADLVFNFSQEYSGGTPPAGARPWLTATIADQIPGTVVFTFTAENLVADEFVSGAYFNLNPVYGAATTLDFSAATKTGSFLDPAVFLGTNEYGADGGGRFDVRLSFDVSGDAAQRFGAGDSVQFTVTGQGAAAGKLVAADFSALSAPPGGRGPLPVAAHVQGIGFYGLDSGWVSISEAPAMLFAGAASSLSGAVYGLRRWWQRWKS